MTADPPDTPQSDTPQSDTPRPDAPLPTSPEALLDRLAALGIEARTISHPPLFTVEESKALRGELPGGHCKNLFLKDAKGRLWLVVALEDTAVDLKRLPDAIGSARISFGSAELLFEVLGVRPGSVTPFAVVNDTGGRVTVVLERRMLDHAPLHYHPLVNTLTTALAPADLLRFLDAVGHPPVIADLPERPPA